MGVLSWALPDVIGARRKKKERMMMKLDFHHFQVCQALTMFITSNLNVTVVLGQCQRADLTVFGEIFPYTSSIFSVYVVFENLWTPLSASFSRLLQRYSPWHGNCFQLLIGKFWVLIRAMDTIDFASVCFWWGQIAAENAYVIYQKLMSLYS